MRNQKYTALTIIPYVLFNQFKFFSNLFFLLIAVSQFFEPLRVGFLFTYVGPLSIVLFITLTKEAVDDFKRYRRDIDVNSAKFVRYKGENSKESIPASDIRVGDMIEVSHNERIPADMLLIYTTDQAGTIFLRTDQLDGETDWKLRKPIQLCQKSFKDLNKPGEFKFVIEEPHKAIYEFKGLASKGTMKESLSLENTMWANTVLASHQAIGVVIYVGPETRSQLNSSLPVTKFGKLEQEINTMNKLLFGFMFVSAVFIDVLKEFEGSFEQNLITIFRFILLLSSIIPISLRVNLDFAKLIYAHRITNDPLIPGTIARNSNIPEELGRIQYLFTDKTGTLTQNEMVFKQIAFEFGAFNEECINDLRVIVKTECANKKGPMKEYDDHHEENPNKKLRRSRNGIVRDALTALATCHNVTPVYDSGEKSFQAASPDEVALVQLAEHINMQLDNRTQTRIRLKNANGDEETYEILENFPFSSDTKRMGIILRNIETERIMFFCKGAEVVMEEKVAEHASKAFIRETCETLACTGLRTLVIAQKFMTQEMYDSWFEKYHAAKTDLNDSETKVRAAIDLLENNMDFLCVTGVEDKLQNNVAEVIETLRNSGIQIWMLTGDKVETATCIAISTGLKSKLQNLFYIKEKTSIEEVSIAIEKYSNQIEDVLVIDGKTLQYALGDEMEERFFSVVRNAPAVICCRCSPTQKRLIVTGMKKYTDYITAAIGDGGNDVAMILAAHAGIGIEGKEGKQASLSADFSITEFNSLKYLLTWHGRLSYKRSAVLSQFVVHRGLIISVIQIIFSIMFYFTSIPFYNGYLMLGYATVFTTLPVFSIIFDEDCTIDTLDKFPILYKEFQKGKALNTKTFLIWCFKSIFQGAVILLGAVLFFDEDYLNIISITFTSLIFVELLNVYLSVHKLHIVMMISLGFTLGVYLASMFLFQNYLDVTYIFTFETFFKIIMLTLITWSPFAIFSKLYNFYVPDIMVKIGSTK